MLRIRSLVATLFMAIAVVGGFCAYQPVEARDRPGTPNQEALSVCGFKYFNYHPALCGTFNNTAREDSKFEMEMTRNGAPFAFDSKQVLCGDVPQPSICYSPFGSYGGPSLADFVFEYAPTDFSTQYCARFRARRVSDQVVSERWSNYACVQTPPQPPVPSKPDFSVVFQGEQTFVPEANATVGETANPRQLIIPTKMFVTQTTASSNAVEYKLTVDGATGSIASWTDASHSQVLDVASNETSIGLNLCAYDASGQSCMHKVISVLEQSPEIHQMPAAHVPLPSPSGTPAISPLGMRVGAPPANSLQRARLMMRGVDLPGNDYSSQPISGTAIDCQTACSLDGKCAAWTWVKPGVQNTQAMCWLKSSIPASVSNVNATSGIKDATADR